MDAFYLLLLFDEANAECRFYSSQSRMYPIHTNDTVRGKFCCSRKVFVASKAVDFQLYQNQYPKLFIPITFTTPFAWFRSTSSFLNQNNEFKTTNKANWFRWDCDCDANKTNIRLISAKNYVTIITWLQLPRSVRNAFITRIDDPNKTTVILLFLFGWRNEMY